MSGGIGSERTREHMRKISRTERIANLAVKAMARVGVGPKRVYLITVVGRKTGKPHTTPLGVVEVDGQRWLVAPYGGASWAKNALASGAAKLRRGRSNEQVILEPAEAHQSAPILKAYLGAAPMTRRAFGVGPEASLEEFEAIALKHPVFRISPARPVE